MIETCLSYPGSKRKAMKEIIQYLPDGIKDWREPFFGGGSGTITFIQSLKSKDCKKFIVGDLYSEVWAFWKAVQANPIKVEEHAREMFKVCTKHTDLNGFEGSQDDYDKLYAEVIQQGQEFWNWTQSVAAETEMDIYQRAARFFIVNQISFSATSDSGSMSKERYLNFNIDKVSKVRDVSRVIQPLEIVNESFEITMKDLTPTSFIFLDPPYIAQEGSGLYGKGGSTHKGFPHQELADLCKSYGTEDEAAKWLMTIDDSIKARILYRGMFFKEFHIEYTMAMRASENALAGEELLITNYDLEDEEDDFGMFI